MSEPSNTYQEPMWHGGDHPLKRVPTEALWAAREALRSMHDIGMDPGDVEPVADAIVMALTPWLRME